MKIMNCRHLQLEASFRGLNETGMPLVEMYGDKCYIAGYPDDPGTYYFIPWLAKTANISIDQAINLFYGSLLGMSSTIFLFCFFSMFKHWASRVTATLAIALLNVTFIYYSDVYIAFFFAIASTIPFFLFLSRKFDWKYLMSIAFSGIVIGYANLIRSHSGTGVLIFFALWTLLSKNLLRKEKIYSLILFSLFLSIPFLHFNKLQSNRDRFLHDIDSTHKSCSSAHPFWHAIYQGLGYTENKYGIEWCDSAGYALAHSIDPTVEFYSQEYEQILKNHVFHLLKTDPLFILKTIWLKFIRTAIRFMVFANLGLLFFFYVRPSFRFVLPFIALLGFYSLPGIMVMPFGTYSAGLACASTVFGVFMICSGIEKYAKKKVPICAEQYN